jgi:hypothetical protein
MSSLTLDEFSFKIISGFKLTLLCVLKLFFGFVISTYVLE